MTWVRLPLDDHLLRLAVARAFEAGEDIALFCGICELPFESMAEIHIDHDHATGSPRGLLCRSCNLGLAMFEDTPAVLRNAAAYLEADAEAIVAGEGILAK